ncbi:MAG: hypothetical protein BGP19_12055 [Thiobacillus sp. 0-1251]|nr:MAG: hypothetical protein BGP19_12055 [Thiobacillus sp. 0-1251]
MAVAVFDHGEAPAGGPGVGELFGNLHAGPAVGDASQALGGIVVVGDDELAGAVLRFGMGDEAEGITGVDGGLAVGARDAAGFELALGFTGIGLAAPGVDGGLAGGDLDRGLAGCQLVVDVPVPFPGVIQGVGFGDLAVEVSLALAD